MVAVCCVFVCRCVIRPRWREAKLSKRSARRRPRARVSAMLRHRWRRTLAVTAAATVSTATASTVNSAVSRSTIEAPVILSSSGKRLHAGRGGDAAAGATTFAWRAHASDRRWLQR